MHGVNTSLITYLMNPKIRKRKTFCNSQSCCQFGIYLQDEDKVVDRFVPLEEIVLRSVFVFGIELEFLHNAGMFNETQQDLL